MHTSPSDVRFRVIDTRPTRTKTNPDRVPVVVAKGFVTRAEAENSPTVLYDTARHITQGYVSDARRTQFPDRLGKGRI